MGRMGTRSVGLRISKGRIIEIDLMYLMPENRIILDIDIGDTNKWTDAELLEIFNACRTHRKELWQIQTDADVTELAMQSAYIKPTREAGKWQPNGMSGFVYAVEAMTPERKLYKIGKTRRQPDARTAEFVPRLPYAAELVWSMPVADYDWVEAYLHQAFAEKRIRGEWFALNERDLNDLDAFAARYEDG